MGLVLPRRHWAVAVIAPSVVTTGGSRRHGDGWLAIGISRAGRVVSFVATADSGVVETHDPRGWVIDACRRTVDLATEPCRAHPVELLLTIWLDRVMVSMVGAPGGAHGASWQRVVAMSPAPRRWHSLDPVELGTVLGSAAGSWAGMRRAAIRGRPSPIDIEPAWAEWMDDAMFARWCLGYFPELDNLRADVEFLAPPAIAENIELAIRAARSAAQ